MEGSIAGLMGQLRTEVAESEELLKCKLCEDLPQELSAASGLRSTVCTHFCQQPVLPLMWLGR